MAAAKKKFIIEEKATFKKRLIWSNKTKRPLNLTGYTALMQIKAIADEGSAVLLELSQANGRITITPLAGTIDLYISAADVAVIPWTEAVYDLVVTAPDGTVIRLLQGQVTVSPGVTLAA